MGTVSDNREVKVLADLEASVAPELNAQELLDQWKSVPAVNGDALRADIAEVIDLAL